MKKAFSYGFDAPGVIRGLFLVALLCVALAVISFQIERPLLFWVAFLYCSVTALLFLIPACWMVYGTLIAKPKIIAELIDSLEFKGDEKVLDVGCGRGMVLIEAAKRLPKGQVCGVDLWSTKDQSGNAMEQTLSNAKAESVEKRIEIKTADMRSIPYPAGMFDVVVSSLAIHNIPEEEGRQQALSEILRVLKPGGKFALIDIRNTKQYCHFLNETQLAEALHSNRMYQYCPPLCVVRGKKR